jgi:hypothetical protein
MLSVQSSRAVVEAGKVAELEAAQAAAQAALMAEMDLLRRQKAAAEEQARRLELQVLFLSPIGNLKDGPGFDCTADPLTTCIKLRLSRMVDIV